MLPKWLILATSDAYSRRSHIIIWYGENYIMIPLLSGFMITENSDELNL